jgi:hypothetical protein
MNYMTIMLMLLLAVPALAAKRDKKAEAQAACAQTRAEVADCSSLPVDPEKSVLQIDKAVDHKIACLEAARKAMKHRCKGDMAWKVSSAEPTAANSASQ